MRTSRPITNTPWRSLYWKTVNDEAFRDLQETLRNAVTLSYLKPDMVVCVSTDSSDRYWSGVVTQTSEENLCLPVEDQRHEPLAFKDSAFKGA